jgi:hypothetical protein
MNVLTTDDDVVESLGGQLRWIGKDVSRGTEEVWQECNEAEESLHIGEVRADDREELGEGGSGKESPWLG